MTRARFDINPATIRSRLAVARNAGTSFDLAWEAAIGDVPASMESEDRECLAFSRKHFKAAYYNNESTQGRCFIPELDVSNAILMAQHSEAADHKRCRSGDGCDRLAVRGQFGKTWCEYHGAELDRIAAKIQVQIDNPKARSGGRSIVGTRGVRAA